MSNSPSDNSYLDAVLEQQQKVDLELRAKKRGPVPMAQAMPAPGMPLEVAARLSASGGAPEGGGRAVDYRITGFWRWKTVVVPPNVYVVHTRRGHDQPRHIGMGISFSYDPSRDAFLVIPAAMQTIVINARCIGLERQGILVQAYVQWIIDDIATAYRKLDFSDAEDPMRIVNVQLREQAEAAIKDKVSTLRIDEVLADKQPIIEELTTRLRATAEGTGREGGGLGLKIVTVQIKEAVVSSTHLWENLQKPFRAERERLARMAELETEGQVGARELEIREARETAEIAAERALERARAEKEREAYDRTQAEQARRARLEAEAERAAQLERNATEKARRDGELELAIRAQEIARAQLAAEVETVVEQRRLDAASAERERARAEARIAVEELQSRAAAAIAERDVAQMRARRDVENDLSENHVRTRLIASLPEVAAKLPAPRELKAVNITSDAGGPLAGLLASVMAVVEGATKRSPRSED